MERKSKLKFHGEIPQEFGGLFRLRFLNLSSNALSGKIPANLSYCSELVTIDLTSNKLERKILIDQLSSLKKLKGIGFTENNLTGEIPSSIGNLSSLTQLTFDFNNLEGNLPMEMGLLKRLSIFSATENKLAGIIPVSIFNSSTITAISVAGNSFHGSLPTNKGQIPTNLGDLTNLQLLNLGANFFRNNSTQDLDFIASLTNCSNLRILSLSGNKFGGVIPRDFGKLQNLQHLCFDNNQFSGQIASTIYLITTSMELYHHNFCRRSSLMYIKIGENSFSGSLPPEVGKLIHLVDFNVSHNQFVGAIPTSLADCSNLANLSMQANFFQGTIPPNLASLKSIQQIDLSSNNLTGSLPKELEKLQYLRNLNLSYNDIEGEIPNTGIFSNASQISLIGNNKFYGGILELEFPPCPMIKGKNRGKLKVVILLSIVLPAMFLVLGTVLLCFLAYRKTKRRLVAKFSSMSTRVKKFLQISYHELLRATSGFSPENLIGSGNFGAVYKETTDKPTSSRSLNLSQKLNIAIDVASALQYLHNHYVLRKLYQIKLYTINNCGY
nr:receptor kinase-like protein Xa21 [Coffea arabica]